MTAYYYDVDDCCGSYEDAWLFNNGKSYDLTSEWQREWLAEEIADDYWSNHDGWEGWQAGEEVTVKLWIDKDNFKLYTIYMEVVPSFSAYEKKDSNERA